jgi:hypothetical protein
LKHPEDRTKRDRFSLSKPEDFNIFVSSIEKNILISLYLKNKLALSNLKQNKTELNHLKSKEIPVDNLGRFGYFSFQDNFIYTRRSPLSVVLDLHKILQEGLENLHANSPAIFKTRL